MVRDNKPEGFFYLDHRTVDSKHNIITDVHVTAGNVHDSRPYLQRLDRQISRFDFKVKYVGLDAGYLTNAICKGLNERNIKGAIAYRLGPHEKGKYTKNKFQYVKELDIYVCPQSYPLNYKTTDRNGYKEYVCDEEYCRTCCEKTSCLAEKNTRRVIRRHVWEAFKDDAKTFLKSPIGKCIYKRRKETVERSFADSKELHGLRYCHMRGIDNVREQCLLTAVVQNMKKIALALSKLFSNSIFIKISYRLPCTSTKLLII